MGVEIWELGMEIWEQGRRFGNVDAGGSQCPPPALAWNILQRSWGKSQEKGALGTLGIPGERDPGIPGGSSSFTLPHPMGFSQKSPGMALIPFPSGVENSQREKPQIWGIFIPFPKKQQKNPWNFGGGKYSGMVSPLIFFLGV